MSSPPADPWAGQPDHDPTYGGTASWPNDWADAGGQQPYDAGWSTTPQSGVPSAGPHPALPYGGTVTPQPTNPYAGYPPQHSGYQPGYPVAPVGAPPPRRPSSTAVTLSLIGVFALLLGGGGLVYFALDRDRPDDRAVHTTATPTPAGEVTGEPSAEPSTTPSATPSTGGAQVRLVAPDTVAGRQKSTDPTLQKLADDMVRDVRSDLSASSGVVGAFYGGAAEGNLLMVVAVSAYLINPAAELDSALEGITENLSVTDLTAIAPGPLGGVAKCGNGESSKIPLGVCGWADNGSVGLVVVFHSSSAAAAAEFGTIRAAIEHRD